MAAVETWPAAPAGAILTKSRSHCPGPKMWNQDPRLASGGNLYKTESQCPGPKMWNQDPGGAMGKLVKLQCVGSKIAGRGIQRKNRRAEAMPGTDET